MTFRDLSPQQIEAIRQQFVTSGKPAKIGEPFGLSGKQVSDYACKHGWKAEKAKVSEALAEKTPEAIASRLVATAADYVQQHTNDWQTIRSAIMDVIEAEPDPLEKAKMSAAVYKAMEAVQKGQRLSLGLDKDKPPEPTKNDDGNQPAADTSTMDDAELAAFVAGQIRSTQGGGE